MKTRHPLVRKICGIGSILLLVIIGGIASFLLLGWHIQNFWEEVENEREQYKKKASGIDGSNFDVVESFYIGWESWGNNYQRYIEMLFRRHFLCEVEGTLAESCSWYIGAMSEYVLTFEDRDKCSFCEGTQLNWTCNLVYSSRILEHSCPKVKQKFLDHRKKMSEIVSNQTLLIRLLYQDENSSFVYQNFIGELIDSMEKLLEFLNVGVDNFISSFKSELFCNQQFQFDFDEDLNLKQTLESHISKVHTKFSQLAKYFQENEQDLSEINGTVINKMVKKRFKSSFHVVNLMFLYTGYERITKWIIWPISFILSFILLTPFICCCFESSYEESSTFSVDVDGILRRHCQNKINCEYASDVTQIQGKSSSNRLLISVRAILANERSHDGVLFLVFKYIVRWLWNITEFSFFRLDYHEEMCLFWKGTLYITTSHFYQVSQTFPIGQINELKKHRWGAPFWSFFVKGGIVSIVECVQEYLPPQTNVVILGTPHKVSKNCVERVKFYSEKLINWLEKNDDDITNLDFSNVIPDSDGSGVFSFLRYIGKIVLVFFSVVVFVVFLFSIWKIIYPNWNYDKATFQSVSNLSKGYIGNLEEEMSRKFYFAKNEGENYVYFKSKRNFHAFELMFSENKWNFSDLKTFQRVEMKMEFLDLGDYLWRKELESESNEKIKRINPFGKDPIEGFDEIERFISRNETFHDGTMFGKIRIFPVHENDVKRFRNNVISEASNTFKGNEPLFGDLLDICQSFLTSGEKIRDQVRFDNELWDACEKYFKVYEKCLDDFTKANKVFQEKINKEREIQLRARKSFQIPLIQDVDESNFKFLRSEVIEGVDFCLSELLGDIDEEKFWDVLGVCYSFFTDETTADRKIQDMIAEDQQLNDACLMCFELHTQMMKEGSELLGFEIEEESERKYYLFDLVDEDSKLYYERIILNDSQKVVLGEYDENLKKMYCFAVFEAWNSLHFQKKLMDDLNDDFVKYCKDNCGAKLDDITTSNEKNKETQSKIDNPIYLFDVIPAIEDAVEKEFEVVWESQLMYEQLILDDHQSIVSIDADDDQKVRVCIFVFGKWNTLFFQEKLTLNEDFVNYCDNCLHEQDIGEDGVNEL